MNRDPRTNPITGDILSIFLNEWHIDDVEAEKVWLSRKGAISFMAIADFRQFFKLASVVNYGRTEKQN